MKNVCVGARNSGFQIYFIYVSNCYIEKKSLKSNGMHVTLPFQKYWFSQSQQITYSTFKTNEKKKTH